MPSNEEIKIKITAEDKASGVLSNLSNKVGGLTGVLKTGLVAGVAAAGTALAGLGAFALSSFKAFADAEKEMVVANQLLENTLGATSEALAGVKDAMDAAGKAAVRMGFDDEAASVAFSKLFAVTKDVAASQKELQLAMDLSAFSGQSLEAATSALVRVHAGGTRVLKEFGLEVKEGTTAAEALALVQEKVGGTAAAMADTTAGKMAVLSLSWQNLKETVGAALAEAIAPFIDRLVTWAQSEETQEKIQQIAEGFANFAKQLAPVVEAMLPALIQLFKILAAVGIAFAQVLFKDIPNAVAAVVVKFIEIQGAIERFIMRVEDAIRKARELASSVGSSITGGAKGFVDSILPGAQFRAAGGSVTGGSPYIVGERGPELFVPSVNGGIVPNNRLGGVTINITGTFLSEDAAERLTDIMIDRLKLNLRT